MATFLLFHTLVYFFMFSLAAYLCLVEAKADGFSIDLIHRESPQSPSYNPHLTPWERVQNSLSRSNSRASRLASASHSVAVAAHTIHSDGDLLMSLSIGTPPFKIVGVADTGSDLIWTQCQPCKKCYKQKNPLFAPRNSSTYKTVSSGSNQCRMFEGMPLKQNKKICAYEIEYKDDSHSHGIASTDKLTMHSTSGKPIPLPNNIVFGCAYENVGDFNHDASGIIVIDSGTTLTYLPQKLYFFLEANMKKKIRRTPVPDPNGVLRLCYKISDKISPPIVTVHFKQADVKLRTINTFLQLTDNLVCLAFSPDQDISIFGSVAQKAANESSLPAGSSLVDQEHRAYFMAALIFTILSFSFLSICSLAEVKNSGFTVDLIHRDSLLSPLRNFSASYFDSINTALHRSKSRAFAFRALASGTHSSELISSHGDFLMKLSIGTPPSEIIGLADTGSVLSWTQCAPCDNCYPQKQPLFAPKKSSTYKEVAGNSKLCKSLGGLSSILGDNKCKYFSHYLDGCYSHGTIFSDTITLNPTSGTPISQKNFVLGCGYENLGNFNNEASGVIGLGGGPGSLITQMNSLINGKFSYCLVSNAYSNSKSSKMHFGSKAVVSGAGVVSTGLHMFKNSLYAVRFKGISVGNKRLAMSSSSKVLGFFNERITIDSGTILTHLPKKYYQPLEAAMKKEMKLEVAGSHGFDCLDDVFCN
ncbi:hypothetical protein ACJIZ3_007606 [Penstemon smallii]|uniref:Peptidase A1 domain-containing protein n=1 Tax=Penstemon smallii TaxID=265156 RepID=A0ABD3T8H0_9LAMI